MSQEVIINFVLMGAIVLWLYIRIDNLKDRLAVLEHRIKALEDRK